MRVGFIGLGMMGKGMAANLQKAGHQLTVHDLNRAAAEPFLAKGAEWANSPRAVAEASEVIFTSLPVPADVEAVALGPNGLIDGMKPDTAFFDMSTNSVAMVRKINAAFAEKNLYMLDSPVSGGPVEVVNRELMAGLLQIGRHALAHHAQPDKTDAHLSLRGADRPNYRVSVVGSALAAQAARDRRGRPSFGGAA